MTWKIILVFLATSFETISAEEPLLISHPADYVFGRTNPPTLRIQIGAKEIENLRSDHRKYVPCTVRADGAIYVNVGLRLKGQSTFQPLHQKPNLTLKFDEFLPEQTFHGCKKFFLNNAAQDPTFLHEYLASLMFRDVGVPSSRVAHARVELNGRDLGLCVLVEAMNKQFLRRSFGNDSGNLYEGTTQDINSELEQDNGNDTSQQDRLALFKAATEENPEIRLEKLRRLLDIDRFLKLVAMELCLGQWDGYARNRNNYRIYHDPRTDLMVFLPHGLDSAFFPGGGLRPLPGTPLVDQLYSLPEIHREYWAICSNIVNEIWHPNILTNRIHQATARMLALAHSEDERQAWLKSSAGFSQLVIERHRELQRFLKAGAIKPVAFNAEGTADISTGWEPLAEAGDPILRRVETNGESLLTLEARQPGTTGSWRLPASVPQGRYLFKAEARRVSFSPNPPWTNFAAGLRHSGHSLAAKTLTNENHWQELSCVVEVNFGGQDMELICELSADAGGVSFRESTLRLERIKSHPLGWERGNLRPIRANPQKP